MVGHDERHAPTDTHDHDVDDPTRTDYSATVRWRGHGAHEHKDPDHPRRLDLGDAAADARSPMGCGAGHPSGFPGMSVVGASGNQHRSFHGDVNEVGASGSAAVTL